jgi:hydrogenase-4 component F
MILLYLTGSVLIALCMFLNTNRRVNRMLIAGFLVLQWIWSVYSLTHKNVPEYIFFIPDALSILMTVTLSIISIPALVHSYDYIYPEHDNPRVRGIYFGSMVVLIMSLTAAYVASHIAVTWIFVEITTLSASALIFHRRNSGSIEATWKYIFVCSISLVFVFIGILFLSIALGDIRENDMQYSILLRVAPSLNTFWLKLAFIFIFIGYTAKLGLIPMYTAGIDAKDKAPSPAAALFSSVLMNVGFVGVFRCYEVLAHTSIHKWVDQVMLTTAFLSIFVAAVYMLKVKNVKRMLAYSSIEHMGIVILALAAGGIGYYAAILHLILHSFAKSSLFLQVGHLYKTFRSKNIYSIGNYFRYNVPGAVLILFGFICITAMPPSGMFISELMVFRALIGSGYTGILILMLILLTLIVWAMGKNIFKMLFIPVPGREDLHVEAVSPYETLLQYLLLALVVYLGIAPPAGFADLIKESIINLNH